ncbi:hypothetical protein [Enterococcus phage vB_EFaS_ZC1]
MWGYISEFRSNYSGEDFRISQNTNSNKITLHHVVNDYSGGNGGSIRDIDVSVEDLEKLKGIIDEALTTLNKRSLKVYFTKSATGELMLLESNFSGYRLIDFITYDERQVKSLEKNSGSWRFDKKPQDDSFNVFEKLGLIELSIAFNETIDFEKLKGLPLDRLEEAIVPFK